MRRITTETIECFRDYLISEEKADATLKKYIHDIESFRKWHGESVLTKEFILKYKAHILEQYTTTSVNGMLSSLNSFFTFMGWNELRVKTIKVQKQLFAQEERELSKREYERLLSAAQKDKRLHLLMQCICSTGIRVSELRYITVESIQIGKAEIINKGKRRIVFLPTKLCTALKNYVKRNKIKSGSVFITKNGNPLDRSNIWSSMKKLCESAKVSAKKVFPHNLRHLFARTYYTIQKDIVRLADILGHSSVNTTRIYTQENGEIHRLQIQNLGLLRC